MCKMMGFISALIMVFSGWKNGIYCGSLQCVSLKHEWEASIGMLPNCNDQQEAKFAYQGLPIKVKEAQ